MGEIAGRTHPCYSTCCTFWVLQSHKLLFLGCGNFCVKELSSRKLQLYFYHSYGPTANQLLPGAGRILKAIWDRSESPCAWTPRAGLPATTCVAPSCRPRSCHLGPSRPAKRSANDSWSRTWTVVATSREGRPTKRTTAQGRTGRHRRRRVAVPLLPTTPAQQ